MIAQIFPLLTEAQVADLLGVSIRTLQAWRQNGGGPPFLRLADEGKRGAIRYGQTALINYIDCRAAFTAARNSAVEPQLSARFSETSRF